MNTGKILKVERIKETILAPGKYPAVWSGYQATIKLDNGEIRVKTENGVRGIVPCVVVVTETGVISLENTEASNAMSDSHTQSRPSNGVAL